MQRLVLMMVAVLVFAANAAPAQSRPSSPIPSVSSPPPETPAAAQATIEASKAPADAPSATPLPTVKPEVRALPVDGAFSLPGSWNCETLADSDASSVYKLIDRTHMSERTVLHLPNRPPVKLDSVFSFDAKRRTWNLSMQKGAYTATAPVWSEATWMFQGNENDSEPRRAVRLVYTSLGPDAFRSDFQAQRGGQWQTFSGATCKRYTP